MTWQPIETAPKDREILVTGYGYKNGKKTRRRFYSDALWSGNLQNFVDPWRENRDEEFVELTHWMEIPKILKHPRK